MMTEDNSRFCITVSRPDSTDIIYFGSTSETHHEVGSTEAEAHAYALLRGFRSYSVVPHSEHL